MRLTKAEEAIMQSLWERGHGTTKEIRESLSPPVPAVTTVSTIIRILEDKGWLTHKKEGRGYRYFPKITADAYRQHTLKQVNANYFQGKFANLVSFFAQREDLDMTELDEVIKELEKLKGNG